MKKVICKYWFLIATVSITAVMLVLTPQTGVESITFAGKNLISFLFILTPVFVIIGLMDVWIGKETMVKLMGDKSGLKGVLIAVFLGVVTAVPLYALLPVAGLLLKKGSKVFNVLLFICSSASIRIPLLLFEVSSLGLRFTITRLLLNIVTVFAISFIIDRVLSFQDKQSMR